MEQKGVTWCELVDGWELAARQGDIFIRKLGRTTVEDYAAIIRKHTGEWMKLNVEQIDRARAWTMLDRIERDISISRRKRLRSAIDAVYKWAIISGAVKNLTGLPTEGFVGTAKEEEKMPEILNLDQIRALLQAAKIIEQAFVGALMKPIVVEFG